MDHRKRKAADHLHASSELKQAEALSNAPPQGVSYAADIAEKYGVTFEQIKEDIDGRS